MKTNKKLFLLLLLGAMCMTVMAQRHTDKLDRGLVVSKVANANYLTWRRLPDEYFDVTYNVYRGDSKVATELTTTNFQDNNSSEANTYSIKAVINGVEQSPCTAQGQWQYDYLGNNKYTSYLSITLAPVYSRNLKEDITSHYQPNDIEMADLDGDGQLEIIIKRINTVDEAGYDSGLIDANGKPRYIIYPKNSTEFVVLDAYDVNWNTGSASLLWRIDCGPNMVSHMSTEINIIAFDWDEDGKAEVVLRGADNMIIYGPDGKTVKSNIGNMSLNTRDTWYTTNEKGSSTGSMAYTHSGAEFLLYLNGETGDIYQQMEYPLKRLESNETDLDKAWGDGYGHRSSKYFFGAPFLDGRKASLFLGRGIYTRHKMITMDLDRRSNKWTERWRWDCNNSSSPWYGNGYHNYIIADVDEDGRDEIVYGSMVIDDNGNGLSTTGLGHGDAQHVSDFDPYRKGLEFYGCNEDNPGSNYRNATTSKVYYRKTSTNDDGRALMGNFYNLYPGSIGRSASMGLWLSSVRDREINGTESISDDKGDGNNHLNSRIFWDGDLCSEILDSPGTASYACIVKPGTGRIFTSANRNQTDGGVMNNGSKNNPCFLGDIIGDWREEIIVRRGTDIRVYTSNVSTRYSPPTLWNDHQYRQAMVWQMMAYNQPPHLSYFLGELEDITVAPPTLTNEGRTEIENDGTISSGSSNDHLLIAKTDNMTVNVSDGAAPAVLVVNTPTWVQGHDNNNDITTTTYTHTLTGGAFTGKMRLVKQGNGILQLPNVTETYTGNTDVWAGTLRFNGTMQNSAVWLNRFTTLETNGGTFTKSITADYGSTIAVGSEGITVGTLTLNYGARLVITLNNDLTASQVNVSQLVLNSKTGDAWENYGPKYLKPVVEFRAQSGSVANGTYDLGAISNFEDKAIIEGLEGISQYSFESSNGHLFLVVGTGEAVTCPEATFDISGYHSTTNGLLPIVSINPGTFSYGGSDVTPAVEAKFNGEPVDLFTLFNEDFESSTNPADYWVRNNSAYIYTPNYEGSDGQAIGIQSDKDRGDYTPFKADYSGVSSYIIEFDTYFNNASKTTELVVMSKSHFDSWTWNYGYHWHTNTSYEHNAYLLKLSRGESSTTFTVNDTEGLTLTLNNGTWYHLVVYVDVNSGSVSFTVTKKGSTDVVASGDYTLPEGESAESDGIYIRNGRYNYAPGGAGLDNIRIYRTDGAMYAFPSIGTLTVTTSYPGCQSASATYEVTEAIMPGDVNKDGKVNIVDVAQTISYMTTGQEPEGFVKAAADIDCNGTVDKTDLDAIVRLIAWQ